MQPKAIGVVGCHAVPETLDTVALEVADPIRIARDELLVVSDPQELGGLLESLRGRVASLDPHGLVVDMSDGYAAWGLRGDDRLEAFIRLCEVPPPKPSGCEQALFANVPSKILAREGELTVVVSSVLGHHVHARILQACLDLDVRELAPMKPLTAEQQQAASA